MTTSAPARRRRPPSDVRPRCPSTWPQGMPNDRPMTSRSGAIAQAAPASQNRSGGPGRRKAVPSASAAAACVKTVAIDGYDRQDQVQVEQIRVRRPGHDEIAGRGQERHWRRCRRARAPDRGRRARPRTTVPASTSAPAASVGPSVPSVPAASTATPSPAEMLERRGQRELLATSAAARAAHRHRRLPRGDQTAARRQPRARTSRSRATSRASPSSASVSRVAR